MSERDKNFFPQLWIVVDKRGQVLDHGTWVLHGFPQCQFPGDVFANRSSARFVRDKMRKWMTKEVWDTWKFRVVGFTRMPEFNEKK